ncbi:hypothetical protein GPECTOR_47g391 [Gonium pectorale]|uniref:WDR36/Utp21 C-terminal domain-containing protein n=1 Tax=Gonium pectorale TaxID=33097 RepID=A0A150G8M3_GONPE|nr:hypothetical protein GPECTOR_47g391 [Gonium pectorale]|eukprot:KXZ46113.1 hypothetical protein GPECTOR_47g391 [Gonium pectorale]
MEALFGSQAALPRAGAAVRVVRAALPSISSGRRAAGEGEGEGPEAGEGPRPMELEAAAAADNEDEDGMSEDEAEEEAARRAAAAAAETRPEGGGEGDSPPAAYSLRDPVSGAPLPLAPELVTLSLLPRSHWDSLAHIELIKARNKPLQPPKKPEAAPFFLPSLPGLAPNPVFDVAAGAGAGAGTTEEAGGDGADAGGDADGEAGPGPGSAAGSRVLEGSSSEAEEVADLGALLDMLAASLRARRDFEFCQALLSVVLAQQSDAIASRPELAARASRLGELVGSSWRRLDGLLQGVRCMLGFLGNLQA